MYPRTRSWCFLEITGPIWVDSSRPYPSLSFDAWSVNFAFKGPWASPIPTITDPARHRSPAVPYTEEIMLGTIVSSFATGRTTRRFFAPPPHWTRFPWDAARAYTSFAICVEPTNDTPRMSGWLLTTPGGKPAISMSSKRRTWTRGSCSDGFATQQFPVATAYGQNQDWTIAGKLNGEMPANTPRGWYRTSSSCLPGGRGPGPAGAPRVAPPWAPTT